MNIKKYIANGFLSLCVASALFSGGGMASAAEAETNDSLQPQQMEQQGPVYTYKHDSIRYGYSIYTPTKPAVIPASMYNENDKGDVLIFSGNVANIQKAWIVCINGYTDELLPENLATMTESEARPFLQQFAQTYGLEYAQIVEVPTENADGSETMRYGICGPTAMEVEMEVDTDGDGVMDATAIAVANKQMMKLFIPGQYGGHFVLALDEGENGLNQADVTEFLTAGFNLQQWPTSGYNNAKEAAANSDKNK